MIDIIIDQAIDAIYIFNGKSWRLINHVNSNYYYKIIATYMGSYYRN